jgi:hypothetical protein
LNLYSLQSNLHTQFRSAKIISIKLINLKKIIFAGEKFTLRDALDRQRPLVRDNVRECVNTGINQRVTVAEAVLAHALNPRTGKFTDLQSRAELSLRQAYDFGLIQKPLTLTEVNLGEKTWR